MKESWDGEFDPLAALREGREAPFEAFVQAETRTFLGFFSRLGARRSEAEDLVQETFLKLFRLARTQQVDAQEVGADSPVRYDARGQFRGYAFRVARNIWIDRVRKRAGAPRQPADETQEHRLETSVDPALERPMETLQRAEESSRIRSAVAALPEAQRAVFDLGVVEELPYADIAAALDIPVGTVKSRMYHAVRRVRTVLEDQDLAAAEIQRRRGGQA